jgi:hypothetical protein
MALIDFISYDEVRAALGVSQDEIKDTTLSLNLYDFNLVSELESISLNLIAAYMAQVAVTPSSSWTAAQTRFVQSTKLFAAYAVAKQLTVSLPMFGPKEQSDGKASLVRFAQDPYKATIASVVQQYETFRVKLAETYAALQSTTATANVTREYFSVATPDSNPILGT